MSTSPVEYSPFPPTSDPLAGVDAPEAIQQRLDGADNPLAGDTPTPDEWLEPEPLGNELPDVPAFDPGLLPDSLRPLVEDVAERMQAPLDFPAVAAIATLAGVTNRRAVIQPKAKDTSWVVTPNIWGGMVAPPGMMKSPVMSCITHPARAIEAQWRSEHEQSLAEYQSEQERAKLDCAAWAENYKHARKKGKELPDKPVSSLQEPIQRRLLTSDATFEALHQSLAQNPAGLFLLRDELTGWLAGLERQGREQERSFYLECWNGDSSFTLDRIGRGSVHAPHVCISLFGGIQPARLRSYLADALKDGPSNDGLIQRFQLLVWPDAKSDWRYTDATPNQAALERAAGIYRRLAEMDAENPARLKFQPDAQEMFVVWLTDLEERARADDTSPAMQAHLAKYRSLMPSLALLFSLADGEMESVSLAHAKQAADWCDYLEAHARRVYASRMKPERTAAITLSKRLANGWRRTEGFFTPRDLYRHCWSGLAEPDEARAAIRVLEDCGWVRKAPANLSLGRPSETYFINPGIGVNHAGR